MLYTSTRATDALSRYSSLRHIIDSNCNVYTESQNTYVIPDTNCTYHQVEVGEEGRLDIIADIHYQDPTLYWVIALANNIIDPFIIIPGTILKIPQFTALFEVGAPLNGR